MAAQIPSWTQPTVSAGRHPCVCGRRHSSSAFWEFRRGGGLRGTTMEHGAEFGDLGIDAELLLFKTYDGGGDDFGCEFVRGHKNQYGSHISCAASSGVLGW